MSREGDFCTRPSRGLHREDLHFIVDKAYDGYPASAIARMLKKPLPTVLAAMPPEDQLPARPTYVGGGIRLRPAQHGLSGLPPLAQQILSEVCKEYDLKAAELRGPGSTRRLFLARQDAYWRLSEHYSNSRIGQMFGKSDHTAVGHGIKRHKARMEGAS